MWFVIGLKKLPKTCGEARRESRSPLPVRLFAHRTVTLARSRTVFLDAKDAKDAKEIKRDTAQGVSPALALFGSFAALCVLCVLNQRVVVSHGLKMCEIQHLGACSVRVPVAPAGVLVSCEYKLRVLLPKSPTTFAIGDALWHALPRPVRDTAGPAFASTRHSSLAAPAHDAYGACRGQSARARSI